MAPSADYRKTRCLKSKQKKKKINESCRTEIQKKKNPTAEKQHNCRNP